MSRILLLSIAWVGVFAAGCSAQSPDRPSDGKPDGDGTNKDGAKAKSLDDLTRGIAGEADAALKAKPDDLDALWNKANAEFHLKDHKASRAAVEAGLKKSADDPRFRFLSAALHSVSGESEKFQDGVDWFLMRDLSYTFALGRLPLLAKKEDREKHHDAHQAAWLVTEGRATPTTEAALGREPDNGAFALLSASWSKWLSNEEMNRLQVALVAVGKPAKPMLEATFDTLQTQLQTLQGDFNKYAQDSIAKAGRLGLIADDNPEAKKKLDTLLQETKDRGKQHQMEVKQYDRMLAWTKETYQQIKD